MVDVAAGRARIALTGATGFVGTALQQHLLTAGYAVRALVRPASRQRASLAPATESITVELADAAALRAALHDVAAVIYCAGSVRGARPADFEAANVDGVRHVAAAIAALPQPVPLLHISSIAASRPEVSHYSQSKHRGEQAIRDSAVSNWTIFRPPALYGPGDREMLPLLSALRRGLALQIGPPGQRVSLMHVEDLARAVLAWLAAPARCAQQIYAIDDGRPGGYDWAEMSASVARGAVLRVPVPRLLLDAVGAINVRLAPITGRAPMLTPGKVRELWQPAWLCDNTAYSAATGWRPELTLAEGARRLFGGN